MIEWIKALSPIIVAIIPVLVAVYSSARKTRESAAENIAKARIEIEQVRAALDKHATENQYDAQKLRRVRILRFADDVSHGKVFSDEYWSDIIEDVDAYKTYCMSHPEYVNSKGKIAMELLRTKYMERMSNK